MDCASYAYDGKLWRPSTTVSDKNSFFHAAVGIRTDEGDPYSDKRARFRRMRWSTFLTYFENETIPPSLIDVLKKCLSARDKYRHISVETQEHLEDYVSDIVNAEHEVTMQEVPILATLENVKIVLFSHAESDPVIITPDVEILGNYPNTEKPKGEVVLYLERNVFCRLNPVDGDSVSKSAESVKETVTVKYVEPVSSGLIRYKKGGSAGSEGVQFQVGLLTIFFLNALRKLTNWKLSTENKAAGKFDDVVLEWPGGATLLQAKHKQSKTKKITLEDLLSTNSKNDDFSLPKYFLSYEEVRNEFQSNGVIICTNASVDGKSKRFLKAQKVFPESMLHYEGGDYELYTFNDEILPLLKENVKFYYEKNYRDKRVQETVITDERIKDFLEHLQIYFNYPTESDIGKVTEQLLSHMKRSNNVYGRITALEIYTKIHDWFQQKDGVYLTELYAKAIFSEVWTDRHWQRLEKYSILLQGNDLNFQNSKRLFHVLVEGRCLLQEIKIFRSLQNDKAKILFAGPDDGSEIQKQAIDAFELPQYTILVLVGPKIANESLVTEASSKLREILEKYHYKKVVLVTGRTNELAQNLRLCDDSCDVTNGSVTFDDLSADSQERLLRKKSVIFQGERITLEELFVTETDENCKKSLNSEVLEKLTSDETIKVGVPLLQLPERIVQFYVKRKFKRGVDKSFGKTLETEETVPEEDIFEVDEKVILIADDAGTGKSTVLAHLAVAIKAKHPHLWVIRIDLDDYTGILKDFLEKNKTISILELLNYKPPTKLSNHLEMSTFSMVGKVVLMLDGFDEISPDYMQLILSLLSSCREQPNFAKIFVTTRPHTSRELEQELRVRPFVLEPFTKRNQIDFLTGYWLHNSDVEGAKKDKCEHYAKTLMNKMSSWMEWNKQGEGDFAGVPLQVGMLAEIFQENDQLEALPDWEGCREYLVADDVDPKLPADMNVTSLFRMFIKKKRGVFIHKGNPSGNTAANQALIEQFEDCLSYHRIYALEVILDKAKCELFSCYQQTTKNCETNLLRIGIVQKLNGELHFVHRTFAEYFVADSLVRELQLSNKNVEFQKLLVEEILLELRFSVTRVFFDSFLRQVVDDLLPGILSSYQSIFYTINSSDIHKFNLLHFLAEKGHVAIFRVILKCVDFLVTPKTRTILAHSPRFSLNDGFPTYGNFLNTVLARLREGFDIKDVFRDKTLLEYAVVNDRLEMAKFLVKQGASVNVGDFRPLRLAMEYGYFEMTKFLVEQGADINSVSVYDQSTVLFKAIEGRHKTVTAFVLDELLKTDGLNINDPIIPYAAAYLGRLDFIKNLLERGVDVDSRADHDETPIFAASRGGQLETIRFLTQQGIDVNGRDYRDHTVLHVISRDATLVSAAKLLIELGIDVNAKDSNSKTALHIAVEFNNFDFVKLVVGSGADVNLKNEDGATALHLAAWYIQGDVVKFLVKHGADTNSRDVCGCSALHAVVSSYFPSQNLESSRDRLDIARFIIKSGGDINIKDSNGQTALQLAQERCQLDIVSLFAEIGVSVGIGDKDRMALS